MEFGDDQVDEVLVGSGHVGGRQHESVTGFGVELGLHLVGDLGRGAGEDGQFP